MPGLQARIGPPATQTVTQVHTVEARSEVGVAATAGRGTACQRLGEGSLGGRRNCKPCAPGQGLGGRRTAGPRSRRRRSPTSGLWRSPVIHHPTCTQPCKGPRKRKGCAEPTLSDALGAQSLVCSPDAGGSCPAGRQVPGERTKQNLSIPVRRA